MPLEGVVNALRRIHAALVPDGLLVDTQPVSAHPPVVFGDRALGTLDMREWAATIVAVDRRTARAVAAGLFRLEHESSLTVADVYDDGPELLGEVGDWAGTRIPPALAHALSDVRGAVSVRQEIRLRVYLGGDRAPSAAAHAGSSSSGERSSVPVPDGLRPGRLGD